MIKKVNLLGVMGSHHKSVVNQFLPKVAEPQGSSKKLIRLKERSLLIQ